MSEQKQPAEVGPVELVLGPLPEPTAHALVWHERGNEDIGWVDLYWRDDKVPSDWDGPPPDESIALFTADQLRAAVAAERERIKARLLGMDDAAAGRHNYYAHAAWVLFDRKA